jgi:hypothetical protein
MLIEAKAVILSNNNSVQLLVPSQKRRSMAQFFTRLSAGVSIERKYAASQPHCGSLIPISFVHFGAGEVAGGGIILTSAHETGIDSRGGAL